MASANQIHDLPSVKPLDIEQQTQEEVQEIKVFDYAKKAQWLRAAVLGAIDGLLSTASLMMGVGAVQEDAKTMILTGIAGSVAGACSTAIGELVTVYNQCDIEMAQMKREDMEAVELDAGKEKLLNPWYSAGASALAFAVGALVPLLGAAFVEDNAVRIGVVTGVISVVSLALIAFGGFGALLGKAPVVTSSLRVLIGGWLAMGLTYGLTKLFGSA